MAANEDVPLDLGGPVDAPFERFEEFWVERPLIERFQEMVAHYGDKIAVDDGVVRLTYDELSRASLHLAKAHRGGRTIGTSGRHPLAE